MFNIQRSRAEAGRFNTVRMNAFDQLPFHQQMCWAARVLEAANTRCGMPPNMSWTAADLLAESAVLAAIADAL